MCQMLPSPRERGDIQAEGSSRFTVFVAQLVFPGEAFLLMQHWGMFAGGQKEQSMYSLLLSLRIS